MLNKIAKLLCPILASAALVVVALSPFTNTQASPEVVTIQAVTLNSDAITTTTTFTGNRWTALGTDQPHTVAEIYFVVDIATVNTTTFALQVSPDGTNWFDSNAGTLATVVTDTSVYTRVNIDGAQYRIVATAENTNTLTPTIKLVLR